jgi:hypothetical protein
VEDIELQNELLLDGHLVSYAPDAVVWAEMPESLAQAASQNQRWERGRLEMARRYVPKLLAAGATARRHRIAYVDGALDHLVPPLSVLFAVEASAAIMHGAGALVGHRPSRTALAVDIVALGALVAHAFAGLASVGAPPAQYKALLTAPRQVLWKVGLWGRALRPDDDVTWTRTERNVERSG